MAISYLSIQQIAQASLLAGREASADEIAEDLGVSVGSVRQSLASVGVRLAPKPFGFRPVTVTLSPQQVENLRSLADRQGFAGADRHALALENLARRVCADPDLARGLADPTMVPIMIPKESFDLLQEEAHRRGKSGHMLAAVMLDVAVKENMVDAIIDDHEEAGS